MSVTALILGIETVVGLIQRGLGSAKQIVSLVEAGRVKVTDAAGAEIPADRVLEAIGAAETKAGEVGDAAEDRVERRHGDDAA